MKKIFIVMLLFLSFSLTSCNRVKFEKYENEVESVNFRSEFAGEYQEFYKRLIEEDFEYKCIYKITTNQSGSTKITNLTSNFKQDLDSQVYKFTEKGTKNDVRTNYEDVEVNTDSTYYLENNQYYLKDINGEISEVNILDYVFTQVCRVIFLEQFGSSSLVDGKYYLDDNKFTKIIDGESMGTYFNERSQIIFKDNTVTFWSYEMRTANEQIYISEIKMVFIFKDLKLN